MALALDVDGAAVASAAPTALAGADARADARTWTSIVTSFGVVVVAYVIVLELHGTAHSTYRIASEWSAFAGLFIVALAIERALEPFTKYLGPDTAVLQQRRDEALVKGDASDKAARQADLKRGRELTAVVVWGAATSLGFVLSSALNITLLQAIRADGSGQPPFWADLLVTGLVLGAGTKPLHDLVTNLQKSKDSKGDPAEVGGLRYVSAPEAVT